MNKMTVGQLKKILENYENEYLVLIDHIEGCICPNLITEVQVKPVNLEDNWDGSQGDYKIINNSPDDSFSAVYISIKD
jgi:hypothetical protein